MGISQQEIDAKIRQAETVLACTRTIDDDTTVEDILVCLMHYSYKHHIDIGAAFDRAVVCCDDDFEAAHAEKITEEAEARDAKENNASQAFTVVTWIYDGERTTDTSPFMHGSHDDLPSATKEAMETAGGFIIQNSTGQYLYPGVFLDADGVRQ